MTEPIAFGDLKRQHTALHPALMAATERVLQSGWFVLGPEVKAFEAEFAARCGVAHCIGVANGTEALSLALAALAIGPGDEVITVANAAVYEALTVIQAGAKPVFVDVDPQTHNLDPALLEAAITPQTRAIIPVHLYGRMAEMGPIMDIAVRHGLPVIEDCAQAVDATYRGKPAGSLGVMACFSFYPTKNLGALGDGGAVVTNAGPLDARLRRLRQYGWERKYYSTDPGGLNSRLDELQAAYLRVKLPYLADWTARRVRIAAQYTELLTGVPGLLLPEPPDDGDHVYHLYVVRHPRRDALQAALKAAGIGVEIHYPIPAHQQPLYQGLAPVGSLPVTEQLAAEILSLPMYPELTDQEITRVAAAVRAAVEALA
jgi:dTDP-4-amino-4,6-dideoxygalactose transaminase